MVHGSGLPHLKIATFLPRPCHSSCFAVTRAMEGNHLAVLILAWAYILSARWAELQSPPDVSETAQGHGMQYAASLATQLASDQDIRHHSSRDCGFAGSTAYCLQQSQSTL